MTQIIEHLHLSERVRKTISLGESHFREFKSALISKAERRPARDIAVDIGEELVAFANADGGELIIGVEDNGEITGVLHGEKTIKQLLEAPIVYVHSDTPLPMATSAQIEIDGKTILYFAVSKGTQFVHVTSSGRCLKRSDKVNVPLPAHVVEFERKEQLSRQYDRGFCQDASITDLDTELINRTFKERSRVKDMSPEKILQYLDLAEYQPGFLKIKRGALLLFAKDIKKWHPSSQVRFIHVRGNELKYGKDLNIEFDDIVNDNIISLTERAWNLIRPSLNRTRLGTSRFEKQLLFPEDACLEALVNAIAHRDYNSEGRGIDVYLFDDRLEIRSPGGLLSTVTIESLRKLSGVHESRNSLIAKCLTNVGYMRELGEGIRRIFSSMKLKDMIPPDINSSEGVFNVVFKAESIISDEDERYLESYKPFEFSKEEKLVIILGRNREFITSKQIENQLGEGKNLMGGIIHSLRSKGVLYDYKEENSNTGQPKARGSKTSKYIVRTSEEVDRSLRELFASVTYVGGFKSFDETSYKAIHDLMDGSNIYKAHNFQNLTMVLQNIGLLSGRLPHDNLNNLWNVRRGYIDEFEHKFDERSKIIKEVQSKVIENRSIYIGNIDNDVTQEYFSEVISDIPRESLTFHRAKSKKFKYAILGLGAFADVNGIIKAIESRSINNKNLTCKLNSRKT